MEVYPDRCPTCRRPVSPDAAGRPGSFLCPICGSLSLCPTRIQVLLDHWVEGTEDVVLPDVFVMRIRELLPRLFEPEQRVFELRLRGHSIGEIHRETGLKYERKVRRILQRIHRMASAMVDIQDLFVNPAETLIR